MGVPQNGWFIMENPIKMDYVIMGTSKLTWWKPMELYVPHRLWVLHFDPRMNSCDSTTDSKQLDSPESSWTFPAKGEGL